MRFKLSSLWSIVAISVAIAAPVASQDSFYKGKSIRLIVGASAGGGYDTYSRTIARHMGKYIPGNPVFVVENMAGAGFLISANYMYRVAKPDGLTVGHFSGGLFLQQLLGKPGIEFDANKFEYIGVPAQDSSVFGIAKSTGVTTLEQWLASKTPIKLGGVGPGSITDDIPKVLAATIGLPMQLVTGYKGTADIRLAFASGEIHGVCNSWESFKSTWSKELAAKEVMVVAQALPKSHPELSNVPLVINYAKTDEARKLIRSIVHTAGPTARPYVLPPGTPKDRVEMMRKAFTDTLKDPEFLAEAKKANLDINPLDGNELERAVKEILNLEPALIPKAKEILK
jgi:tripartite-type tricarboxylate transporter receptor subunit TctC